jgi:hypothetical protein
MSVDPPPPGEGEKAASSPRAFVIQFSNSLYRHCEERSDEAIHSFFA